MVDVESSDDRLSIVSHHLSLILEHSGDRWTHHLEVAQTPGGPRETIARAVEWDTDRDDPLRVVSPVYQEAHFQYDPEGRPQALLIGRAGPHHFSAVFTLIETPDSVALTVEVADRCRAAVEAWGATYTVLLHSGDLADSTPARLAWNLPGDRRLTLEPGPSAEASMAEAGRSATRAQVVAARVSATGVAQTRICHYNWTLHLPTGSSSNRPV